MTHPKRIKGSSSLSQGDQMKGVNLWPLVAILMLHICLYGCANDRKPGLILPDSSRIVLAGISLKKEEIIKLKELFSKLKVKKMAIYRKSDADLLCFFDGRTDPKPYAIFMKDRLIYEGYFIDAWTRRMKGKMATFYKMDSETFSFLQSVIMKRE